MTPEEFARQCAEMRAFWEPWLYVAAIALVLGFILQQGSMLVRTKWMEEHGYKPFLIGSALGIGSGIAAVLITPRVYRPQEVIYERDYAKGVAKADYAAFLERMKLDADSAPQPEPAK